MVDGNKGDDTASTAEEMHEEADTPKSKRASLSKDERAAEKYRLEAIMKGEGERLVEENFGKVKNTEEIIEEVARKKAYQDRIEKY